MNSNIASHVLQYAGILTEAALLYYLARIGEWGKRQGQALYLLSLLAAALPRAFTLHSYGLSSPQYFYVYWSTDLLLVLSAFLLVCFFFRRACRNEVKMWGFARLLLAIVFVLVVGVSVLVLSHKLTALFPTFIFEFNQNLYFACLVLNTLLYLLLVQIESTDDQLGLLVCGVGIQFAGPSATLALVHLTEAERFAQLLNSLAIPLCTLAMLLVWAYALVRVKDSGPKGTRPVKAVLAEVTADSNF